MSTPDYFTEIKRQFLTYWGLDNANVTKRAITYGARDGWSGWRAVTWTTSTIEVIVEPRGFNEVTRLFGLYPRLDGIGLTKTAFVVGDQILDAASQYWDVRGVKGVYYPGSSTLIYNELQLTKISPYQTSAGATTWTKTRSEDPRHLTKDWIDTYARTAQITKDDDNTAATWACIFSNPPYSLEGEFRNASSPVQGLYVVEPSMNSIPVVGHDKYVENYVEHMPIHIVTIDSTSCNGTALQHKMVAELRYVDETYPFGSVRLMETQRPHSIDIGGMILYDCEWLLTYERSKST